MKFLACRFGIILISFLFVNGIVFCFQSFNLLKVIDFSVLKILSGLQIDAKPNSFISKSDSIVIMIDDLYYEKYFNATSPLNTKELSYIVNKIAIQNPKSIVFDIDISPDFNFNHPIFNFEPRDIELLLSNIQKNGIAIYLPFSFVAGTTENKNLKQDWFRYICKNNIALGVPLIQEDLGASLFYFNTKEHISQLINSDYKFDICNQVLATNDISSLKENFLSKAHSFPTLPINYAGIQTRTILLSSKEQLDTIDFKNKVVFMGGSYGYSDKYIIPGKEVNGIEILEAIYYTLTHKIEAANIVFGSLIDIVNGIAFGFILSWLLGKRINFYKNKKYEYYTITNLFIFALLIIWIALSLLVSSFVFESFYIWLNPIPIIIGMFLDAIFSATSLEHLKKTNDDICEFNKRKLSLIIKILFISVGIYSIYKEVYA